MLDSVSANAYRGFMFLEKGLAHPSFLGRAVSWGIFYGVVAIVVKKICIYAIPKILNAWKKNRVEKKIICSQCSNMQNKPNTEIANQGKQKERIPITRADSNKSEEGETPGADKSTYETVEPCQEGKEEFPNKEFEKDEGLGVGSLTEDETLKPQQIAKEVSIPEEVGKKKSKGLFW